LELSPAAKQLKPSATLAINETIAQMRGRGEQVLHMGFGESPFPVHPRIRAALCRHADKKSYLPTQGIQPLRERISQFYGEMLNLHYPPERIIVGPGSKSLSSTPWWCWRGLSFCQPPPGLATSIRPPFWGRKDII